MSKKKERKCEWPDSLWFVTAFVNEDAEQATLKGHAVIKAGCMACASSVFAKLDLCKIKKGEAINLHCNAIPLRPKALSKEWRNRLLAKDEIEALCVKINERLN